MAVHRSGRAVGPGSGAGGYTAWNLIAECIRRPSTLAAIGMEGVTDRRARRQLFGLFLGLSFMGALARALLTEGLSGMTFVTALLALPGSIVSVLTTTLAMWVLATFFRPKARFGELLTGMVLCTVLSQLVLLVACVVGGVLVLTGAMPSPEVALLLVVLLVVLLCVISGYYIMGAFQVGCGGAILALFLLGLVNATLESVQKHLLDAVLPG
jgi:hypothetical protein